VSHPKRLSQEDQGTLLRRLQARDESALAELYDALAPWVLGLAHRILHDEAEAEEVLSDVFLQVWQRIAQHDATRGPLVPWVLSITRNRALDGLRRRRRWWRRAERWGIAMADESVTRPCRGGRCTRRCTPR
jgi:RNA polymerase sigma-70 factor, ECF subfamily